MKIKKKLLASIVAAVLLVSSVPVPGASAASLKYKNTYVKSITMEEPTTTDTSSAAASSAAATDTATTASTDATATASTTDATATTATVKTQEETVKVMAGMQFVISTTRYGKLIKTSRNKTQFKYKTSKKKVATVTNKGVVTTLKNGKCDITVTNKKDGTEYIIHLIVVKNVKVKKIKLSTTSEKYKKLNKTFTITANIKTSTKKAGDIPFYWYSTDKSVATVDQFGKVTIKGYGTCEIRCIAGSNGKVGKCKVTVVNPKSEEDTENANVSENRPTYNTGKVVDISYYNTVTDWSKLKQSCDAVIIRIGYRGYGSGTLVQDASYASNVYNCQQYGIPYSVYFYTQATTEAEGVEEANWIANKLAGQSLCFPVFIDTEYANSSQSGRADGLSKSARTAAIKAACAQLNARGISAGVYSGVWWLNNMVDMSQLPYYLWVAHYNSTCGYSGDKLLWQFTSSGSGYGVRTGSSDRCDVSYWYQ